MRIEGISSRRVYDPGHLTGAGLAELPMPWAARGDSHLSLQAISSQQHEPAQKHGAERRRQGFQGPDGTDGAKTQHHVLFWFYLKSNSNHQSYKRGTDSCCFFLSHNNLKRTATVAHGARARVSDGVHEHRGDLVGDSTGRALTRRRTRAGVRGGTDGHVQSQTDRRNPGMLLHFIVFVFLKKTDRSGTKHNRVSVSDGV